MKKKDSSTHLVMDYGGLNEVMIRNRYTLSLMPTLLESRSSAGNLVQMHSRDDCKIAF